MQLNIEKLIRKLINTMIMNIRQYLVSYSNFEINQQYLGFQATFHRCIVKNSNSIGFSITRFRKCNEILVKTHIKYYKQY